ncbi:EthD domain-containing protein [Nocardia stercoris]|uniref:Uncharacterized protein n=1 Tax=Nocardia stercoris TaxID=2483361 RepID=A0A3M2L5Y4_9NOCA|nr:EthD domain-containing protein [Nocardia stercoris]RMI31305.1 hypothetical protein EBN03_18250 [Nocardia stercoris]
MEKVIFALRRADNEVDEQWCERLRTEVAKEVTDAGVAGLTVYVRDQPMQAALMRLTTIDPPITAVVGIWVEQSYGPVVTAVAELLRAEAPLVHGYLVTESVPLRLPETIGRTEGFGNIAFLRRPADLTPDAWRDRWQSHHTGVAIETQATFGYTQNLVVRPVTPDAPVIDAIVEEQFPAAALTDPMAWYGATDQTELTDRVRRMIECVSSFGANRDLDTVPTSRYHLSSPFSAR